MQNLIIFCGGVSAEHEVSLRSARNIIAAVDKSKYKPMLVIISRGGTWYLQNDVSILERITECADPFPHGEVCTLLRKQQDTLLLTVNGTQIKADVAFPVIHGPMGEDGTIQGLFEIMNLPYVGSGVLSSAVGMDKDYFKRIMQSANLPIAPFVTLYDKNDYVDYHTVSKELASTTMFIKPASMGSSVGISKVKSAETYDIAVQQAFKYCSKVLIEKFVPCREIECAVLGNSKPKTSGLAEIKPNLEFYSYEAKYIDPNGADLIIPAVVDKNVVAKIQDLAVKAFMAIDCKGLARADFFLSESGEVYVNELNTMPGFTAISMYPQLWEYAGISYSALISNLIALAFEVHRYKQQICLTPDL